MPSGAARGVRRVAPWIGVAACLALFVWLRMPGICHLLMWDEAQDVIAARALAAGAGDGFAPRLWAHPPALPALSLLVQPLEAGFAERYELLVLAVNAVAFVALFLLNRRIFGNATALWSCFLLAVMPGAIFYDVWIKGGCVVSLAMIGAVAALLSGQPLLGGLCLGLALLDKETAVFPCLAVGILVLLDPRYRNVKTIACIAITTFLTSGWWYLCLSSTMTRWLKFATGIMVDPSSGMPWHSHFVWLYGDMGIMGCVLLAAGAAWAMTRSFRQEANSTARPYAWWPLLTAVITYGGFTFCRNKSPWFTMFVYPALATIQAIGMAGMVRVSIAWFPRWRPAAMTVMATCAAGMLWIALMQDHEQSQRRVMPGSWARATRTRAIVDAVNSCVAPGDRLLTTTLSFHGSPVFDVTSPIFMHYLTNMNQQTISCTSSFEHCAGFIIYYHFDWALFTPLPGTLAAGITNGFKTMFDLDPVILDSGTSFLYHTAVLYQRGSTTETPSTGMPSRATGESSGSNIMSKPSLTVSTNAISTLQTP